MNWRRFIVFLCITVALMPAVLGSPYSAVVVYGDSLSDNGNLFAAIAEPQPPYFNGRASNGPVAVELLATTLGAPLLDFAFGGATTGLGNHLDPGGTATSVGTFGLPGMTPLYFGSLPTVAPLAASALFVIWGGPDDFLSPSPLDANGFAAADRAVTNLVAIASGLQGIGAQQILVPGMPDLGLVPFNIAAGPVAAGQASLLSDYFNTRLEDMLPPGVVFFDTAALLRTVIDNPGAYGFTNVTDACFVASVSSVCSTPGQYLFWDDIHPSARAHEILAANFAAAVPEPSTFGFAVCGVVLWCLRRATSTVRQEAGPCRDTSVNRESLPAIVADKKAWNSCFKI
jgi:cholinesterase